MRPVNGVITFLSIYVGALICSFGKFPLLEIILAGLAGACAASAGNIVNYIYDIEIDKINRPSRVLPSGALSVKTAWLLFANLNLLAVVLSTYLNSLSFIIVLFAEAVIYFYSYQLKKLPLIGNATVALMTALAFVFGGAAVNNINASVIPAVFAFLINFIREIVKDMEDVEGDKQNGVLTFPIKYGFRKSTILIIVLAIILFIFTFFPFLFKIYKIEFFIMVMVTVNVILVYFVKSLLRDHSNKNIANISRLLKLGMVLGLVAIYIGAK